jgi:tetratricopeptide (TPR) repeat protein
VVQTAILLRERGDLGQLLSQVREIQSFARGVSAQAGAGALIFSECGRIDEAYAEIDRLFASGLKEQFYDPNWLFWYVMLGRVVARIGPAEHARAFYDLLAPYQEYAGILGIFCAVTGINQLTLAMLARSLGSLDRALEHAEAALHFARRMHAAPEEARCHLEIARIQRLRGRSDLAIAPLEAARRIAREIGMKGVLREIAEFENTARA